MSTVNKHVRVRLPDGQVIDRPLDPGRQATLWATIIHGEQLGLIEVIRAIRPDGENNRLRFPNRNRDRGDTWLPADSHDRLARFVTRHRENFELFATPAAFTSPTPKNAAVAGAQVAWIDQDNPGKIDLLRKFTHRPHMVVRTGGSGGVHAFWRLTRPIGPDELSTVNRKLVAALDGDRSAHNPARILRIPGTYNRKKGGGGDGACRIVYADLHQPGYDPDRLTVGLNDYRQPTRPNPRRQFPAGQIDPGGQADWIKQTIEMAEGTSPPDYYHQLTGGAVASRGGYVRCPFADHEDRHPSTFIYGAIGAGWWCFSCGRGGGPFQLAAALTGWTGCRLDPDEFKRAAATLAATFGIERKEQHHVHAG